MGGDRSVVQRFAAALDAEAYDEAVDFLAHDCAYESPDGSLIGPAAIIETVRRARSRFRSEMLRLECVIRHYVRTAVTSGSSTIRRAADESGSIFPDSARES